MTGSPTPICNALLALPFTRVSESVLEKLRAFYAHQRTSLTMEESFEHAQGVVQAVVDDSDDEPAEPFVWFATEANRNRLTPLFYERFMPALTQAAMTGLWSDFVTALAHVELLHTQVTANES